MVAPQDSGPCPLCGRHLRVPDALRPGRRARMRPRAAQTSGSHRPHVAAPPAARNAALLLTLLIGLAAVGGLLLTQSRTATPVLIENDGRAWRAQVEVDVLRQALEHYRRDCGRYPPLEFGLLALVRDPDHWGWDGPYISLLRPDPWGAVYAYAVRDGRPHVSSAGPDGIHGTADDFHSAEPETAPETAPASATAGESTAQSDTPPDDQPPPAAMPREP